VRTRKLYSNNYIIGLNGGLYNPSACLIKNGHLVAWAAEERFIRKKTAKGMMPVQAIKYCLEAGSISLEDVDVMAFGWDAKKYPEYMKRFFEGLDNTYPDRCETQRNWEEQHIRIFNHSEVPRRLREELQKVDVYGKLPQIEFIPHHLAHAISSYYASGFDEASILVADGLGEEICTSLWVGHGTTITHLESFAYPNSLGQLYEVITAFLGFEHHSGEGKAMGLSPYGRANSRVREIFSKIVNIDSIEGTYEIDPTYIHFGKHYKGKHFTQALVNLLGQPREPSERTNPWYQDIAFGLQNTLENIALILTKRLIKQTNIRNLCIGGGVGMNCKMNGFIYQSGLVDDIFIQPASSDEGTALGAALYVAYDKFRIDPRFKMIHTFWGPQFSNEDIRQFLEDKNIPLKYLNDDEVTAYIAEQTGKGLIIGWFQGRMEIGARALGNRSILADPREPQMKDKLNKRVKFREPFCPFCPSILDEAQDSYLEKSHIAPFMIESFQIREEMKGLIPSVVHIDGSVRPQSVQQETNPLYWSLIDRFRQITGIPVILNTSFNIRGMPIVLSPKDALDCFNRTSLDVLMLGNYLIKRPT